MNKTAPKPPHEDFEKGTLPQGAFPQKTRRPKTAKKRASAQSSAPKRDERSKPTGQENAGRSSAPALSKSPRSRAFNPETRAAGAESTMPRTGGCPSPFPYLQPESLKLLEGLPKILNKCMPIKAAHRKDLPEAIQELSALLTTDRGELGRPYWSVPRLFSAYIRSFLPWNLVRLGRLLGSIAFDLPLDKYPLIVDLGSGPLTFPLALWLHKPELRALPLTIVCIDSAPRPMQMGLDIFRALTADAGKNWNIVLLRGNLERTLHEVRGKAALITASQVLNELRPKSGEDIEYRLQNAVQGITQILAPRGEILFVEPGTRLGGKTVALARETIIEQGLMPVAPCPHAAECPMLEHAGNNWCHFTFGIQGAPLWLQGMSKSAHLVKHSLSLSWLLARKAPVEYADSWARVVSEAFPLPLQTVKARYGCSVKGLTLVENAEYAPSGSLVNLAWPETPQHDAKSGALKATLK